MTRKHNFGAGPGILPESALQKAAADVLNFNNSGMGVLEISHRSKDFEAVLQNAKSLVKELLNVPETHEVLFVQGGASIPVAMSIPLVIFALAIGLIGLMPSLMNWLTEPAAQALLVMFGK